MDFFLWLGLAFAGFVLAILVLQDMNLLATRRVRTKGTVFGHRRSVDDGSEYYMAKVRFTTEDGRQIEIDDTYGSGRPKPPTGTLVDVVYPIGAPEKGRIPRLWLRLMLYAIMLFLLTVLTGRLLGWLK